MMGYSKYGNKKINGFDSIKECSRWNELKILEKAGKINGLDRQVQFNLLPAQYDDDGKCVFRGVSYYADFVYWQHGKFVVEDCKGFKTKEYQLKKKMLYYFHRIKIKET